jgi:hypothetical protein
LARFRLKSTPSAGPPSVMGRVHVRSVLRQPLYRGIARRNRLKQHDEDGNPILEVNPESEHVTGIRRVEHSRLPGNSGKQHASDAGSRQRSSIC